MTRFNATDSELYGKMQTTDQQWSDLKKGSGSAESLQKRLTSISCKLDSRGTHAKDVMSLWQQVLSKQKKMKQEQEALIELLPTPEAVSRAHGAVSRRIRTMENELNEMTHQRRERHERKVGSPRLARGGA
jgi:uncharacterized phage infection (PIP) family protein YhgE